MRNRYLAVVYSGKSSHGAKLTGTDIPVEGYVRRLDMDVFVYKKSVRVYFDLTDTGGTFHRLFAGSPDSFGWHRLSASVPGNVLQSRGKPDNSKTGIVFHGLYFEPLNDRKIETIRFYVDEIRAFRRLPVISRF